MTADAGERSRPTAVAASFALVAVAWLVARPALGDWWDRLILGLLVVHVVVVIVRGPEWRRHWYLTMLGAVGATVLIALGLMLVLF